MFNLMYLKTAIIILWLCMVAWLIRYEAFPEYFTQSIEGYKGLLSRDILISDSWMKITFRGSDIGYSHTSMNMNENNPAEHYVIGNRVHISLSVAGTRKNVHALTSIFLDMAYNLRRFTFSFSSPMAVIKVDGSRIDGNNFEVKLSTQDNNHDVMKLQIPPDVLLYSPLTETAIKYLKPGKQITIRTLDPISLKKVNLLIRALRHEKITISNEQIDSVVLSTKYRSIDILSWVDNKGTILLQKSPIGLTMQKCTPEEAYDAVLGNKSSDDVLKVILPLLFLTEKNHD
ncbi:MAG: hypothetical protein PHR77_13915 [Kiritimatiellae bacterium]|nr:hypothetical protein [Kiritimatiellia bacterium]MDD5521353.1 hypothetical protein [Kiritimatiellia bacterium]